MPFGDLEIMFKPVDYKQQNETSMAQFEQQKILAMLPQSSLSDDEKMSRLNAALKEITELTIVVISRSIAAIKAPGTVVTDPEHIEEFLRNCDRNVYNQVRDHVVELNQATQLDSMNVDCVECHHKYEQPMNLDMASFFDSAS
jgi:hypothetical protein